ncbi:MAG: CotH kinase family protein, partial [Deltaproteobacteria bacterium]|nr:CotH kinase family protein [Deltaproteobacteria bacterium]
LETFNFLNTPDPVPFDELIVMDLAREEGLLTPDYYPFRLLVNNANLGVHFFSVQPDEGLLRNARRIPGSLYSGNGASPDPATGISTLWRDASAWKKVTARLDVPGAMKDRTELERLLVALRDLPDVEFASFARDHLALDRFALFDALDVVFGGDQHDWDRNHKLYFDPYRARFEPVAWSFRGWSHRSALNRVENPLQLRLKAIPGYLLTRNRLVLELMDGVASVRALRARIAFLLGTLGPELAADPFWDAYHLLPPVDRYLRQMVRPMDEERQALVLEARFSTMERRERWLRRVLAEGGLRLDAGPAVGGARVDVVIDGHGGVRLEAVSAAWPQGCVPARWTVNADTDLDGTPAGGRDLGAAPGAGGEAWLGLELLPGLKLEPRPPDPREGDVVAVPEARRYSLFIDGGGCCPEVVHVRGVDLLTGAPLTRRVEVGTGTLPPVPEAACAETVPPGRPGHASAHPWCHPGDAAAPVRLGPGLVEISSTRVFSPGQRVEIRPGTTLRLGPGASLVVRGPLLAEGTAREPIRFEGDGWGGVALQGPATAGSRLAAWVVRGGSRPSWGLAVFPATVNLHDTRDIAVRGLVLSGSSPGTDALHVAYVSDLVLEELRVDRAGSDGLDLEFSAATIRGLTVVDPRDEALDLMGSEVILENAVLTGARGSGISAGEETRLRARRVLVDGAATGVLAKNASRVQLRDALLRRSDVAVDVRSSSVRYEGSSRVAGRHIHAADCRRGVVKDRPWEEGPALEAPPGDGELPKLREHLGMDTWEGLDAALAALREEVAP